MENEIQAVEKEYIKGDLLYTIFQNETENFTIAKISVRETNTAYQEKEIVIKGYFSLQENTSYMFFGQFEQHRKFGMQYNVESYQTIIPDSKEGIVAYLSSDLFYGIGKKTATRIVDKLGASAISKILHDPTVLQDIPGLKKEKAANLVKSLQENQGFEHVAVYLSKYNIGLKMAQKIYQNYKEDAIDILEKDPYQYVFDIDGFGFQTADAIARQNGIEFTHSNRIGAGCLYILQKSVQEGHVFLPVDHCIKEMKELLNHPSYALPDEEIESGMERLNQEKKIIIQDGHVYMPSLYYAEDGFVSNLKRIIENPIEKETTLAELMTIIGEIEEEEILSYGKEQFDAIQQALHAKVMILTGGPGTGKTTVVKGIIKAYAAIHQLSVDPSSYDNKSDFPFVLTAPTGRAAKRLNESTSLPARTIHRLLGWDGHEGFEKNEHEPLQGKLLIIDEFSMVDIWLANSLFKAIPDDMQVLLVGDEDQLPSVGPGQVLADLLASGCIPFVSLQEVYRQKEGSQIIQLAHQIKQDRCTQASLNNAQDFSFLNCRDHHVVDVVTSVVSKALEKGYDIRDIQVLAPMYRSVAGIHALNKALQQLINPKTNQRREVKALEAVFRVGDKIIQLVNQPEDNVYNGDIGEVVAIFTEDENVDGVEQLVISFDGKEVVYERKDYVNIMHAYCISIHKSQGSEFPIIILPVVSSYHRMLRKNLLYTGITRAKESIIICGEKQAFLKGVQTLDVHRRFTSLSDHLQEALTSTSLPLAEADEEDALSPYDFMD
ncbi:MULTISPECIES: ATP-dependent RecD-like DNA helicase [unclassified Virgibacillus]|uniref:SF1B family DNA helicase RecD2 n=1 Tax=unclassified Virgibacillus TaxID=2620237 RepID=UPI0024DDF9AB|nr:ATP-dependent RecD-like DNA helicase [Virgibacillus sp. LDC-1]